MKERNLVGNWLLFAILFVLTGTSLLADSIGGPVASPVSVNDQLFLPGVPTSEYQGYFFDTGGAYGSPLDDPQFAASGTLPGTFLFTGNTMFAFTGLQFLSILTTDVSPGQSVSTSALVANTVVTSVPEPRSFPFLFVGVAVFRLLYRSRVRV